MKSLGGLMHITRKLLLISAIGLMSILSARFGLSKISALRRTPTLLSLMMTSLLLKAATMEATIIIIITTIIIMDITMATIIFMDIIIIGIIMAIIMDGRTTGTGMEEP